MLEHIETYLEILKQIPFIWLILIAFIATLVENIFPPSPSDLLLVAVAVISGIKGQNIVPIIISSTIGATLGFWIMFSLGKKFDSKIIETNKIKFISQNSIEKVENLFRKWGFKLVVANRFMSGTRAIISFFAGMTGLPLSKTLSFSAISSFLWYGILSVAGSYFGNDWRTLVQYIHIYDKIVLMIVVAFIVIATVVWFVRKRLKN